PPGSRLSEEHYLFLRNHPRKLPIESRNPRAFRPLRLVQDDAIGKVSTACERCQPGFRRWAIELDIVQLDNALNGAGDFLIGITMRALEDPGEFAKNNCGDDDRL